MIDHGLQTSIILFGRVQEESRKSPEDRCYLREGSVFGWMCDVGHLCTQLRTAMWENSTNWEKCTARDVFNVAIKLSACALTVAEMYLVDGGLADGGLIPVSKPAPVQDPETGDYFTPDPDPLSVSREKLR